MIHAVKGIGVDDDRTIAIKFGNLQDNRNWILGVYKHALKLGKIEDPGEKVKALENLLKKSCKESQS